VLVTVSDKKLAVSANGTTIDYYTADIISAEDYYPFGMKMPGRKFNATDYRYGFNGKEEDDEVKGDGNQIDYGMRVYDPRLGRFLSTDPITDKYPWYTPYQFAGNKPIWCIDLDGLEDIPTNGGNYYSVASLQAWAFKDIIVQKAIDRGERVVLNQSYSVIGNKNPISRQITLNEGSAGSKIQEVNQDGSFYSDGSLGPSGVTMTFHYGGIYNPTPPQPEPPIMPQAPPNPPVDDVITQATPKPKKQAPEKPKPQNPPKPKAPITNPHPRPRAAPVAPAPPPPRQPDVPPPAPDPDHFCLTCFNGESSIHWKEGVKEMVSWLTKNPNYNLNIKADGNSTVLRRGWSGGTGLFGGGPTYNQRATAQFGLLQAALQAAGVSASRISLTLGSSTGGSLNYTPVRR
jgi:RHS repeat-associated protein